MNWDCHYTRTRLHGYLNRELPVQERRLVGQHLDNCPQCQAFYQRQRLLSRDLERELPRFGMPQPYQLQQVWANVQAQLALGALPNSAPMPSRWWYSVAVVVLMLFLALPVVSGRSRAHMLPPLPPSPMLQYKTATPTALKPPVQVALFSQTAAVQRAVTSAKLYNTPVPLPSQP